LPSPKTNKAVATVNESWDTRTLFGLKLTFEVEGGTEYRVERISAQKAKLILYDLKSGKSVNAQYPSSSLGRLFFTEELLGML